MVKIDKAGAKYELDFWRRFVQTDRFKNNWAANVPNPELNPVVADFMKKVVASGQQVLDVGSGVVSILHGTLPANSLTCYDPLGDKYEEIFDYDNEGILPPAPIAAEDVEDKGVYDIVHISNALDHTVNPVRAYQKLWDAVRDGGFLIVQGFEDEATFEKGSGFHQWDLHINGYKHLACANLQGAQVTIAKDSLYANTLTLETGRSWIIWITQKS